MATAIVTPARPAVFTPAGWLVAGALAVSAGVVWWGQPEVWVLMAAAAVAGLSAVVDLRTLRIPNRLTGAGAAAVTAAVLVTSAFDTGGGTVWRAIAGALIATVPLLAAHALTKAHVPGMGDIKLSLLLGAAAGAIAIAAAWLSLIGGLLIGSMSGVAWQTHGRRAFPLAPGLAAGFTLVVLLWRFR